MTVSTWCCYSAKSAEVRDKELKVGGRHEGAV